MPAVHPSQLPPFHEVPKTQALTSKTFTPPPLDGSLDPAELYDWHLLNSPSHPLYVYANEDGTTTKILWPEAVEAIYTGVKHIRKITNWSPGLTNPPIVAILAASDSITYTTTTISIFRAGCIAFPLSPRNSPAAVAHLIKILNVRHVLIGHEPSMQSLASEALKLLSGSSQPETSSMPQFGDLFGQPKVDPQDVVYEKRGIDETVIYLHSSGSTSYPKPIPVTNLRFYELSLIFYFGEMDVTDLVFSMHTIPMFHALGIFTTTCLPTTGMTVSVFRPQFPAQIPTVQAHYASAVATETDIIVSVPSIIDGWAANPEYVKWLASRTALTYGGGSLSDGVGDYLVSQGIHLVNLYGSSECGCMSMNMPTRKPAEDWSYVTFGRNMTTEFVPYDKGIYELVIVSQPFCRPLVTNTTIRGVDAYATADLMVPHPTKPGLWRIYGRCDDQIVHNTGEKTNPVPLEALLNQDAHILAALVFGHNQFQAGILVAPRPYYAIDPTDESKLAEFRNKIWPTVQKVNAFAPQHSRIFKEMIIVMSPSKPFTYTGKGTPRRQAVLTEYEGEIRQLYDSVNTLAKGTVPFPATWTPDSTLDFVRGVVNSILVAPAADEVDLFQAGCDSLQATQIRNILLRALRDAFKVDTRTLDQNFVYTSPTISSLADFFVGHSINTTDSEVAITNSTTTREGSMQQMVEHYAQSLPSIKLGSARSIERPSSRVVLVTGTTGALGSYILAALLRDPSVSKVYCLNRRLRSSNLSIMERQRRTFEERGLDTALLRNSEKFQLLEGDLMHTDLGLSEPMFSQIASTVTTIMHIAWSVNFKMELKSFDSMVHGLSNLISFALSSAKFKPAILFASSISVFQSAPAGPLPIKEEEIPASFAVGTGYAEGKWVAERLLARASESCGLRSVVVRVGQITGGLNGSWNSSEWFPSLVMSAQVLGSFPTIDKPVFWISPTLCAQAFVEFSRDAEVEYTATDAERKSGNCKIVHLVHPRGTTWSSISSTISQELGVPLLPFPEWLEVLRARSDTVLAKGNGIIDERSLMEVPALKLVDSLEALLEAAARNQYTDAIGMPTLDVSCAVKLSESLAGLQKASACSSGSIRPEDIKAWIRYWRGDLENET
ncbi:acetyl-CoA synthetase-like protein [Coprinopsis marcescibilis]|uniref:Acetyl-CoA synthetase-like protein n=1 Tax=Coprinopsis marcescibilis TaxID=230819 RepID=A0A5C3KMM1_COPMA|nr:acetyl-CoA synthetase-like protein [Coprinopsis marcescibilis]